MKNKSQLLCTITLLLGAIIVTALNFSVAWSGDKPQATNMAATGFYLLFWVLMVRFKPAAKASALISLYTMVAAILSFLSLSGEWGGFILRAFAAPATAVFYGIKLIESLYIFYILSAVFSFVVLIFSLITMVNKPSKS